MNFKFRFNSDEPEKALETYHSIAVKYLPDEFSFCSYNGGGNCALETQVGYLCIEFDFESKRVGGISGLLGNIKKCMETEIELPTAVIDGILYVENGLITFEKGVAYQFDFSGKVYFNASSKRLCIGSYNAAKQAFRILKNVYVQLDKDGNLTSMLLTDI